MLVHHIPSGQQAPLVNKGPWHCSDSTTTLFTVPRSTTKAAHTTSGVPICCRGSLQVNGWHLRFAQAFRVLAAKGGCRLSLKACNPRSALLPPLLSFRVSSGLRPSNNKTNTEQPPKPPSTPPILPPSQTSPVDIDDNIRHNVLLVWPSSHEDEHVRSRQASQRPCHEAGWAAGACQGRESVNIDSRQSAWSIDICIC